MSLESVVKWSVAYRRALPRDFAAIVELNSDNFVANLAAEDRRDGFLSAQFTLEQTAAIAADLGTMVVIVDGHVAGFLCAMRNEFDHGSPVVAKMIESYDRMRFEGKPLSDYRSYITGPSVLPVVIGARACCAVFMKHRSVSWQGSLKSAWR
jgi:hypothetical protein